jgi:hypothetical protein
MTAKAIPRHARPSGRQRGIPRLREGRRHRVRAPGIVQPVPPDGPMPADPLAGPVAITQRAVLGDRIRRPTAWCEMAACISRYDDLAALGEADIRDRALGAGWRHDAAGRLVCPYCQRHRPGLWAAYPVAGQDNPPGRGPGQQTGHPQAGGISAVRSTLCAEHQRLLGWLHLPPDWPRLLAALVCGRNGWNTPPLGPAGGALGGPYSAGPAGPSRSPGHRPAVTSRAKGGGDGHRRQQGQRAAPGMEAIARRAGRHAAHRQSRRPRRSRSPRRDLCLQRQHRTRDGHGPAAVPTGVR